MSGAKRRSFEGGHRPKFLVVIDGSPESTRAVHFAARRAARTGASMIMLGIVTMEETMEFLGVGDAMREEAEEEVTRLIAAATDHAKEAASIVPEQVVKEGEKSASIRRLIEEDQDISFLVLATATDGTGPGPLVSGIASSSQSYPIPIVIVPGDLTDEEIDALAG